MNKFFKILLEWGLIIVCAAIGCFIGLSIYAAFLLK